MDNLTHTLIGAALAETGLRRRTRYAAAALMVGANIPDVDVLAIPLGHSLGWRRGITHGLPALVVWPLVLTGAILLWHRWQGSRMGPRAGVTMRARHERDRPPLRPGQLLLLAGIAVITHPVYDWLNSYGMRWLMPIDGTWFYGDSLFIVDPYLMGMLALGVFLSRRRASDKRSRPFTPGRLAVAAGALYTLTMAGLHQVAERVATRSSAAGGAARRTMVAPTAANPFRWTVIADRGAYYRRGEVRLLAGPQFVALDSVPVGHALAESMRTSRNPEVGEFLDWSRWPFYRADTAAGTVTIADLRYTAPTGGGGWASVTLRVEPRGGRAAPR